MATTIPFKASVTGSANTAVSFSIVEPDGGEIDAAGTYLATLVVVDCFGARSTPVTRSVVVNTKPTAVLNAEPSAGLTVTP